MNEYHSVLKMAGYRYWNSTTISRNIRRVGRIQGNEFYYRPVSAPDLKFVTPVVIWIPISTKNNLHRKKAADFAERENLKELIRAGITPEMIEASKVLEFCP